MNSSPTVGVLLSRVRVEEKLLLQELSSRGVDTKVIDDRELVLPTAAKERIESFIAANDLRFETLVLGAWALLQSRMNHKADFGMTRAEGKLDNRSRRCYNVARNGCFYSIASDHAARVSASRDMLLPAREPI